LEEMPAIFNAYRKFIDEELSSIISSRELYLYNMMKYHMGWIDTEGNLTQSNSGKFLRATLCLLAAVSTGSDYKKALPIAASIELIHNFSLIHDDIQDGDRKRRHRPTVWTIWGKPQAINAGTAMKVLANLSVFRLEQQAVSPEKQLEVFKLLDESCLKMLEGQYLDISFEDRDEVDLDEYIDMIDKKTASLIEGALQIGAVINIDKEKIAPFKKFGNYLGLAFQIRDDILGIWGSVDKTGKPSANDLRKKKKSFPIVYSFCESKGELKNKLKKIYAQKKIDEPSVKQILSYFDALGVYDYCEQKCRHYYDLAVREIKNLPIDKKSSKHFEDISKFLIIRDF
jgi:geranylgeranyl diphosphate synthase, type I